MEKDRISRQNPVKKKKQHLHFLYLLTSLMCFYSGIWHYEYLNWLLRILTICFYSLISVHIRESYRSNKKFWQFVLLIKFYQQSYGHLILQSVIWYVNLTDFSTCCEAGHRASCQRTTLQSWCDNSLKTAFSNILVTARPDLSAQTEHCRTKQKGTF